MDEDFSIRLDRMEAAVTARYPGLERLLGAGGEMTLQDYALGLVEGPPAAVSPTLRESLVRVAGAAHDADTLAALRGLQGPMVINTADHCGLLFQFPFFQANLLLTHGAWRSRRAVVVVLATGNVPFNNPSNPRAAFREGRRRHVLPDRVRANLVYGAGGFGRAQYEAAVDDRVRELVPFDAVDRKLFADQAAAFNSRLWAAVMPPAEGNPHLVYLQLEDVAADLLKASLVARDEFHELCCRESARAAALAALDGMPYCWTGTHAGSHLLWGRNEKGRAERLVCRDGQLEGASITVPLRPDALSRGLQQRRLVPSNFLSLMLLLKHGASPVGGVSQVERLPRIQRVWSTLLRDFGWADEAERVRAADTAGLVTGPTPLYDHSFRICGLDDLVREPAESLRRMQRIAARDSLRANVRALMMPSLHRTLHADEQDPLAAALTAPEIAKGVGLQVAT